MYHKDEIPYKNKWKCVTKILFKNVECYKVTELHYY